MVNESKRERIAYHLNEVQRLLAEDRALQQTKESVNQSIVECVARAGGIRSLGRQLQVQPSFISQIIKGKRSGASLKPKLDQYLEVTK